MPVEQELEFGEVRGMVVSAQLQVEDPISRRALAPVPTDSTKANALWLTLQMQMLRIATPHRTK